MQRVVGRSVEIYRCVGLDLRLTSGSFGRFSGVSLAIVRACALGVGFLRQFYD
jgi:hypothetical protein